MPLFRHAAFEISVAQPDQLPLSAAPEIAFAGRSNAGKSSAINTLVDHTRLAFVSKTPGRTQLINLFRLRNGAALVDLPGYGYAEVPESVRRQWRSLLERYLTQRANLVGLVLIMDARRPFTELDCQMVKWFATTGRPIHCLLTKADKLTRNEQAKAMKLAKETAAGMLGAITLQLFSSLKKVGVEEAEQTIAPWLSSERECFGSVSVEQAQPVMENNPLPPGAEDSAAPVGAACGTDKEKPPAKGEKAGGKTP